MGRVTNGLHKAFSTLSRVHALLPKSPQLYSDRFAHPHELDPLVHPGWEAEAGLLVGVSPFDQVLSVRRTPKRRELGNVLVDALTRGGKGLLAISQLLTWPHSVVVLDIKGELFDATAGYRKTLGPVYVIDPEGVGHQFDPCMAGILSASSTPLPNISCMRQGSGTRFLFSGGSKCSPNSSVLDGRKTAWQATKNTVSYPMPGSLWICPSTR
jgi:hypothetical protein